MGIRPPSDSATTAAETWRHDILPWFSAAHVTWNDRQYAASNTNGGWVQSNAALNSEISFDVWLTAGTWSLNAIWRAGTSNGIMSFQIDGVEVGTADTYNGSTTSNNVTTISGIAVATSGKKRVKVKMTGKNASSTNYYGMLNHLALVRTA